MDEGLTRVLAARAARLRYADLPDAVREVARQCVLDYLGVAVAGAGDPLVAILLDETEEAGGTPQASIVGHDRHLPALAAALVNGAAGHALDFDDVNVAMPGHPTVAVLPGLLALAELLGSSGRDVLTAFVAGYEAECRIGAALSPGHYDLGFHSTATIGTLGAAAACARLLGLDTEQTATALGIAGTQAAGLKSEFGTMCKPFHAGKAAQNGLLAARLAARGFSSRTDLLECVQGFAATHGPDFAPEAALAEPQGGWHILSNLFKYHAACYFTHAPIECAREVRRRYQLRPDDIAAITLRIDRSTDRVCNIPSPTDGLQSKFSLRQTVAMALAGIDTADLGAYSEANAHNPGLTALRQRLSFDFQEGWPQTLSEIDIELRDGRRVSARHDAGIPAADIAEQGRRLTAKFDTLVEPVLGAPRACELREAVAGLDGAANIGLLTRLATG
ncbi:MAG TPA: MmgE/PrpD family protein [Stellaceae bacterium]|jgi:2-methylcitrate dehydratase PrpD